MITDYALQFSGAWAAGVWTPQTLVGTGNILSDKSVDVANTIGNQPGDIGVGEHLYVAITIAAAVTGGTSVDFQYVTADDAGLTTNLTVLGSTGAQAVAGLTLGALLSLRIPRNSGTLRRYVGMRYVVVGTNTTGSVISEIVKDINQYTNIYFKSGYSV